MKALLPLHRSPLIDLDHLLPDEFQRTPSAAALADNSSGFTTPRRARPVVPSLRFDYAPPAPAVARRRARWQRLVGISQGVGLFLLLCLSGVEWLP